MSFHCIALSLCCCKTRPRRSKESILMWHWLGGRDKAWLMSEGRTKWDVPAHPPLCQPPRQPLRKTILACIANKSFFFVLTSYVYMYLLLLGWKCHNPTSHTRAELFASPLFKQTKVSLSPTWMDKEVKMPLLSTHGSCHPQIVQVKNHKRFNCSLSVSLVNK